MAEKVVPMIHVPDVRATVDWYQGIGFTVIDTYGDEGEGLSFAILSFGSSEVMFNQSGQTSTRHRREVDLYVYSDNVDDLYGRLKDRVEIVEGPHDTFYGMREFIIRDLNRFWITFGQASVFAVLMAAVREGNSELTLLALLNDRGYQPLEFTSVMFRPIRPGLRFTELRNEMIRVRMVSGDENELGARTAARGWSEFTELADFMLELAQVSAKRSDALSFLAELDGQPIATGALSICEGVALLAGASTIPEGRKQGAQLALLDTRLRYAAEQGCDIAMMCAQPGSASQRNAERQGFRIAYTRVKWRLPLPAA